MIKWAIETEGGAKKSNLRRKRFFIVKGDQENS